MKNILILLTTILLISILVGCEISRPQADASDTVPALSDELQPKPDLLPAEVVKIQVAALQHNDDDDHGIAVTFRFASPENKQITGPLGRFKQLVKSKGYRPLLNHKSADYDTMTIEGDTATQRVTVTQNNGKATVYIFTLSKQSGKPCAGCWLTDGVVPLPTRSQNLQGA